MSFPTPIFPGERPPGALLALHPWKDNRDASGLDSVVCNSLSAELCWVLLWLAGIGRSDRVLSFEIYSLPFFFFLTRYDDVKRDADATVTDAAPAGAASLILSSSPCRALAFSDKCIS